MVDGEEEYEVEAILRHKGKGARRLYLVMWKGYPITEASWEPKSHLQNAPLILEDYLRLRQSRGSVTTSRTEEARRRVDGGPEEHKAMGALRLKDQCLMGIYTQGKIVFGVPNLRGWSYRLCTGAASTMLKICLGWCGASSLMVSGFYSLGDLLTILSVFEDSRSLMGGE